MITEHLVRGRVELFPGPGGWYFVRVPKRYSRMYSDLAIRGLIPIRARVGQSEWKTSLLPMGDGTHFVALNAKVRKRENVDLGDRVTLSFRIA